jgi:hypothetical protein
MAPHLQPTVNISGGTISGVAVGNGAVIVGAAGGPEAPSGQQPASAGELEEILDRKLSPIASRLERLSKRQDEMTKRQDEMSKDLAAAIAESTRVLQAAFEGANVRPPLNPEDHETRRFGGDSPGTGDDENLRPAAAGAEGRARAAPAPVRASARSAAKSKRHR